MPIRNRLAELHDEITGWRRDIHEHPEILYDTHRTSALVAEKLKEFGCDEVVTGIGRTGVVGIIRGKTDTQGRAIGLRADMDALPMQEQTGLDYASKTPDAMHACGHDGHTAMVLGAAKYLAETRNFDGTAVVIFQPAEEGGNGAEAMCQDGLMDRFGIQEVYAMHNVPGLPTGQFAIRSGPLLAAADEFDIYLEGHGGHAAKPHETVDTTVMLSQLIVALQTIVSRNADPIQQGVLSVTSVETSSKAFNVIPQSARRSGHGTHAFQRNARDDRKAAERSCDRRRRHDGRRRDRDVQQGRPGHDQRRRTYRVCRRGRDCCWWKLRRGSNGDGRRGFFLHAGRTPRRFHHSGQWRQRRAAPP